MHLLNNLKKILDKQVYEKELYIIFSEVYQFMINTDWRGACHESCGVIYVLLQECEINCEWKVGEVKFKEREIDGRPLIFDHSWILINNEIYDLALSKTNYPDLLDSSPTIRSLKLDTLNSPEVIYNTVSGLEDSLETNLVKKTPLNTYFDNSPLDTKLGTWRLVKEIGVRLGKELDISTLRDKYTGTYWT